MLCHMTRSSEDQVSWKAAPGGSLGTMLIVGLKPSLFVCE